MTKFNPLINAKNTIKNDDFRTKMIKYTEKNRKFYNPSQLIVLDNVIDMPENDILLVQGPVSNCLFILNFNIAWYW